MALILDIIKFIQTGIAQHSGKQELSRRKLWQIKLKTKLSLILMSDQDKGSFEGPEFPESKFYLVKKKSSL